MVLCSSLIWMIYDGTEGGMIQGAPVFIVAMLGILVIICVLTMVVFSIYAWVVLQGDIKYEIDGEVQLDIAYEPWDAFTYNPGGSIGILTLVVGFTIIMAYVILVTGLPEADSLLVYFFVIAVSLRNVFSKRHYVFTDKGLGFIFFGFRPITMYMAWEAFSGFEIREKKIQLYPKRSPALLGMIFPRNIPAIENLEDARLMLTQYLTEI